MAGKVVFRGVGTVHILYCGVDGRLYNWDCELPFSQYGDLEGEYDGEPEVSVRPCVTSLDISLDENGNLQLRAGMLGQYLLWEQALVTVAEDAYSPGREISLTSDELVLPVVLDQTIQSVQAEKSIQADVQQIVDVTFCPRYGDQQRTDTTLTLLPQGQIQMLYYDSDGLLQCVVTPWEGQWDLPIADSCVFDVRIAPAGKPQVASNVGNISIYATVNIDAVTTAGEGIPMISGLEIGEVDKCKSNRPNLILCRAGKRRLWDVAKHCGSTVESIKLANNLQGEPDSDAVLLIPIV